MALDDEIAEMRAVNNRLAAENIMLRAMAEAFDLIFGPAEPLTDTEQADVPVDTDGGVAREVVETLKGCQLPAAHSPHD